MFIYYFFEDITQPVIHHPLHPPRDTQPTKLPEVRRALVFGFNFPGRGNPSLEAIESMRPLLQLVFHVTDKLRRFKLSKEACYSSLYMLFVLIGFDLSRRHFHHHVYVCRYPEAVMEVGPPCKVLRKAVFRSALLLIIYVWVGDLEGVC